MFDLSGKKALVTGASGGIGRAIAKSLNLQGAEVGVSGTRVELLQALINEMGDGAYVFPADLSSLEEAEQLITKATDVLGGLDILINNAGITRDNLAVRLKNDDWRTVLDVNLFSAFCLSRAVLRGMMKARWGRIISITSIVGVTGNPGQANYAASKAGMIGMSKSLAHEVANRGITVNCIAPGLIETAMTDAIVEEQKSKLVKGIPTGQIGHPNDIAAACIYLASEEASYVTGQTLHVNGGMTMV